MLVSHLPSSSALPQGEAVLCACTAALPGQCSSMVCIGATLTLHGAALNMGITSSLALHSPWEGQPHVLMQQCLTISALFPDRAVLWAGTTAFY